MRTLKEDFFDNLGIGMEAERDKIKDWIKSYSNIELLDDNTLKIKAIGYIYPFGLNIRPIEIPDYITISEINFDTYGSVYFWGLNCDNWQNLISSNNTVLHTGKANSIQFRKCNIKLEDIDKLPKDNIDELKFREINTLPNNLKIDFSKAPQLHYISFRDCNLKSINLKLSQQCSNYTLDLSDNTKLSKISGNLDKCLSIYLQNTTIGQDFISEFQNELEKRGYGHKFNGEALKEISQEEYFEIFSNCKTITNFFKKHDNLLAIYCHIPGDLIHEISINRHNWDSKKLYVKIFTK